METAPRRYAQIAKDYELAAAARSPDQFSGASTIMATPMTTSTAIPMFVHSEIPPGTTEMKDRRADIAFTFEELPTGGRVRITTTNHDALNAVHDFLNFQIADHRTGDDTALIR